MTARTFTSPRGVHKPDSEHRLLVFPEPHIRLNRGGEKLESPLERALGWNDDRWDRRHDSGFRPADVAAGVVDGAIGTAGAIATAPFRSDSYAYYNNNGYYNNGHRGGPHQDYAPRNYAALNGFVYQPGTWITAEDGGRHVCQ
jgi:hypothetical protein